MQGMKCRRDFACYKSGFTGVCEVKETVKDKVFECCDAMSDRCGYSVPFGTSIYCTCPLRIYAARHLGC
jgi:hypothetical protein